MRNKKSLVTKICIGILVGIIALPIFYLVGTGFRKSVCNVLQDYSVSTDGTQITFKVGSWSSIGYTRGFKDKEKENAHYLTFYSTFGGINSSFGAKHEFVLEVDEEDTEIYFYTYTGDKYEYKLVLKKNQETGVWEKTP